MGFLCNEITQTNLYDRVKKLLVSYEWSDCCFSICGKDFKAHKLILGISSPVFEAMFYGPLSNAKDIIITDIEPEIFQLLLNYIYTDKVEINTAEQAFELLYASRKYILDHLTNICISYIKANISVDNVIEVLNYPEYLQDQTLKEFALKLFCEHANYLLKENKDMISFSCMKAVLESDNINIKEYELVRHLLEWTKYYCRQNDLPNTLENKHDVLFNKGLFDLIRFRFISLTELDEIKNDVNNLLLPQDLDEIKMAIMHTKDTLFTGEKVLINSHKDIKPRNPLKLQWYICHRSPLRPVAPIVIDFNNVKIQCRVKANKSIFIHALCVPTRMAPVLNFHTNIPKDYSEQFSVSITLENDNNTIKFINFMNTVEYDSVVDIELNEPCFIKKNEWYKISFIWPTNRFYTYSYVVELRDRFYSGYRTVFEFDDMCTGSYGSFLEGLKFCV